MHSDIQSDYTITQAMLSGSGHIEFYDNDQKIIEWYCDEEGQVSMESFTNKQINILADINAKKCQMKTKGPLFLKSKLQVTAELDIHAEALCFANSVTCGGNMSLIAQQGIGFLGKVSTQSLKRPGTKDHRFCRHLEGCFYR